MDDVVMNAGTAVVEDDRESGEEDENEEDEILRLRHKLASSRQEHTEQNERLREYARVVNDLKATMAELNETHQAELELVRSEVDVIKEEYNHAKQVQETRIRQLCTDAAAATDMEREVKQLRERVSDLLNELETEGRNHAEESHRLTKESFSLRVKLEQTFRKTLQEIDAKYKEQAFSELDRSSKNALVENSKLEEELQIQSIGIESLLKRYKKQSIKLDEVKRDVNLAKTEESMRLQQLRVLKQARITSEARVNHLQENVERLNELRSEFVKVQGKLKETNQLYLEEKKKYKKEHERAEKWKARAFDLSKQMLEVTTIEPMRDEKINESNHSDNHNTPQSTIRSRGGGANSLMWSASSNRDWRGGISSVASLSGKDPINMERIIGQGPGKTTILKLRNHQSLPVLALNPAKR